jgi:hypothetical protein
MADAVKRTWLQCCSLGCGVMLNRLRLMRHLQAFRDTHSGKEAAVGHALQARGRRVFILELLPLMRR